MEKSNFEKLRAYQLAEQLADKLWDVVAGWDHFARDTVGKQLVRAADSIGADMVEGTGRGSFLDNRRFILMARGSFKETQHFLRRAWNRRLLTKEHTQALKPLTDELAPKLTAYLNSIQRRISTHKQQPTTIN